MNENVNVEVMKALEAATNGLSFQSETDAPIEPFFWTSEETRLTEKVVRQCANASENATVETQSLAEFFEPVIAEEDWMNDDERAEAKKFQSLMQVLKDTLKAERVYRVGETTVAVYVVGKVEGGYAGLKTTVVET